MGLFWLGIRRGRGWENAGQCLCGRDCFSADYYGIPFGLLAGGGGRRLRMKN